MNKNKVQEKDKTDEEHIYYIECDDKEYILSIEASYFPLMPGEEKIKDFKTRLVFVDITPILRGEKDSSYFIHECIGNNPDFLNLKIPKYASRNKSLERHNLKVIQLCFDYLHLGKPTAKKVFEEFEKSWTGKRFIKDLNKKRVLSVHN